MRPDRLEVADTDELREAAVCEFEAFRLQRERSFIPSPGIFSESLISCATA